MNKNLNGIIGLVLVAAIVIAAEAIISALPLRHDFTANQLYTVTKGSRAVLAKLDKDVTLKYYFSSSSADMPMSHKTYASQVQDLLKEYELAGNGHLVLEAYDPKPDSDAEEWAQRYGIEPQNANPFGQPIYFGLVAVCGDHEETLARLSPRTESTLEYDITRLITRVAWPERPVVGVMSSISGLLGGQMNPMMMQMRQKPPQGWAAFNELKKDYDVREIATDVDMIDDDVKTLVVLHAKNLSDKALYAIDQFVLRGGRLIACTDPFSIMDMLSSRQQQNPMMQMGGQDGPSTLGKLFDAWGVKFDEQRIVGDFAASTKLNGGNGRAVENPAFLSLTKKNVDGKDLLVNGLTQIMLPFAGAFSFSAPTNSKDLVFTPVITTSKESGLVDRMTAQFSMDGIVKDLHSDDTVRTLAARLEGTFKTAFPKGPDGTNDVSKALKEGKGTVMLFGDSDFLADEFCVQVMNTPFGQMVQPMNDNLALFSNVIEQFAGREELIGVRSRGASNRPFTVVDNLEKDALKKYQKQQSDLEAALEETQQRLVALQKQKSGNERLILSKEQQEEIQRFRKMQADTKRKLKNVRKDLTAGIDSLGLKLKTINIVLIPLLVIVFGVLRALARRKR